MFNHVLEKIIHRENYIDQLSDQQISTIKTKELFLQAFEESPIMNSFKELDQDKEQSQFRSPNLEDPATTLLKGILPSPENSYEEIEQLQLSFKLFNEKKLNQVQIIKELFEKDKDQILNSGLNVSDFLALYESEDMQEHSKDINDPLVKKIMSYFETNTKQHSFYDFLKVIIEGLCVNQEEAFEEEKVETKAISTMRKIRQSVCSLQGFNINLEQDTNQFNEQTKKEMDKVAFYYQNILQIFDIEDEE